jgi:hypothetical protein
MDEIGCLETRLNNEYRNHCMGNCCFRRLVGHLHVTPLTHLHRTGDFRGVVNDWNADVLGADMRICISGGGGRRTRLAMCIPPTFVSSSISGSQKVSLHAEIASI